MKTVAYLRVSTCDQNTEKNKLEIIQYCNSHKLGNVDFTEEVVTGTKNYKDRALGALLGNLNAGDILIVPELSRLARSISQILEIIDRCKSKGIILHSMKEGFKSDDSSITALIASTIFGLVAQIERDLISIRTKEALAAKKAGGCKLGRPAGYGKSKLDVYSDEIRGLQAIGVPLTRIAAKYKVSVQAVRDFLKKLETLEKQDIL
jgi:DNA invertase Pin-like site-specific DNA recombinase